jgi:hypothetical protein
MTTGTGTGSTKLVMLVVSTSALNQIGAVNSEGQVARTATYLRLSGDDAHSRFDLGADLYFPDGRLGGQHRGSVDDDFRNRSRRGKR